MEKEHSPSRLLAAVGCLPLCLPVLHSWIIKSNRDFTPIQEHHAQKNKPRQLQPTSSVCSHWSSPSPANQPTLTGQRWQRAHCYVRVAIRATLAKSKTNSRPHVVHKGVSPTKNCTLIFHKLIIQHPHLTLAVLLMLYSPFLSLGEWLWQIHSKNNVT